MGKIKYLFFGFGCFLLMTNGVNASTINTSISASSDNVVIGTSVKITSTISSNQPIFFIEGSLKCSGSGVNSSVDLKFETMENTTKSNSKYLTIKPTSVGKVQCTINGKVIDADHSNWANVTKSITINVVKPREKSTNNNLKSLSVEGFSLSPDFNKDTLEYTVNLDSNVEKIKINATKEDGYASVDGLGEKEVQEGDNKFEIKVTSETGSSKIYTINAIVKDSNPIEKEIDHKKYTVVKRESALTKPEGFENIKVTIDETEIPAFYNETLDITLVGLKDEDGKIYLFKYDEKENFYSKYEFLTSTSKTIIFENTDETIEGFQKTMVTIENQEYNVYQSNSNKDYLLVYGRDLETGNKNWYLYHIKDQTIQIYMNDLVDSMKQDFDQKIQEYKIVLLGMIGLSLILLIITIVEASSKGKIKKKMLRKIDSLKEELEDKEELLSKKSTNSKTKNEKKEDTNN